LENSLSDLVTWRPGRLAKSTFAMTAGMGLRTLAQAAVFLIVARVLGVADYGAYSAVLALAITLGGFSGLGASMIMLRDTARDAKVFKKAWACSLAALLATAPILFAIYLLLGWMVLPDQVAWIVVVCVGLAEIVFAPLSQAAIRAYQGHERIGRAARIVLTPVLTRLAAACLILAVYLVFSWASILVWAVVYLMAAVVSTGYVLWLLGRDLGTHLRPRFDGLLYALREGWAFAIGGVALKVYADIDKIMLARWSTLEAAGSYSAAYRVVDMVNIPIVSFFAAVLPRFFRAGGGGLRETLIYALRVFPFPIIYALGVGLAICALAPLLPVLLGNQFEPAVGPMRWLAWLPLLATPRLFLQTAFLASGRQGMGVATLAFGALLNIGLNLWMIPTWGWWGAVLATYCSEFFMTLTFTAQIVLRLDGNGCAPAQKLQIGN
jgi:O-antigen/teichoic acid export membrane protein